MDKHHLVIDLGPSTLILLCELILIALKLSGVLGISWILTLLPVIVIVVGSALILFISFVRMLKRHFF